MSELQKTFSIIKPDAVATGKAGKILSLLEDNGFRVVALRMVEPREIHDRRSGHRDGSRT